MDSRPQPQLGGGSLQGQHPACLLRPSEGTPGGQSGEQKGVLCPLEVVRGLLRRVSPWGRSLAAGADSRGGPSGGEALSGIRHNAQEGSLGRAGLSPSLSPSL